MNKILSKSNMFLKRNSSTILTCIGAAGVIATAVSAVKATPKAMALLRKAEDDKNDELTTIEKVRVAGPAYIPSIIIGASTIACIFGANALNKRQQAALTSAYALLDASYKEYRSKVKEVFGEESEQKVVQAIMKDRYSEEDIIEKNSDKHLFFDFYSLQFFRSTMDEVLNAEKYVQDMFRSRGFAPLHEFYDSLGIPYVDYESELGWSEFAGNYLHSYTSIEFEHSTITMDNGEECCVIHMLTEPTSDYLY